MTTLRADIRKIVDGSDGFLPAKVIYGALSVFTTDNAFAVTLCHMVKAQQLRKRKAPKWATERGVRYIYGPGAMPVIEGARSEPRRMPKMKGFMALAREREARERGARR